MPRRKNNKKNNRNNPIANIDNPFRSIDEIDYKDVYKLKKFVTTRGRIIESARTGLSKRMQRRLALAIKRARYMALLPFNEYA
jgi:small subunit ribosomal protein S18